MTAGEGAEVRRLLDRAAEAVDRGSWDTAGRLAERVLALDPANAHALALLEVDDFRSGRLKDRSPWARRVVTVMFCDLVGSTVLSTMLDPEEMRQLLRGVLGPCAAVIEEYDGYVASLLGDGLVAYFGVPQAQEDSAARAIFAGCRIVQRVQAIPPVSGGGNTVQLAVRVGIHTGLAVVSPVPSTRSMETNQVVGETPNLASRLQSVAAANAVVVSSETAHLVRDLFEMELLPEVALRGIRRRVDVLRVIGPRAVDSRFDAAFRLRTRLVGRRAEQERIGETWLDANGAGSRSLALLGDAGIGKSRLIAYAKAHVKGAGGWHRTLQCSPYHLATPLHPVVPVLEQDAGIADAGPHEAPERLHAFVEGLGLDDAALIAVLARLLDVPVPTDLGLPELTPEELRERSLTLIVAWLDQLAARSPLLLAVEDLQWADPTTLELLARVVRRDSVLPILTILASRERGPLDKIGDVPALTLGPLGRDDCAQIIDDVMGAGRLPRAARRLIVERSDGIPLFVEELARMLRHTPREARTAAPDSAVPPTLVELMVARLDQHPAEQGLAQVIATVGQPVGLGLLSQLVPFDGDELRRQLQTLVDARLLQVASEHPEPVYEFRHVLQREAAYELQLRSQRRVVHAAVAAALAGAGEASRAPEILAHHHEQAEDFAAAAQHWYRAGLRHASVAAHAEAIEHYRRALRTLAEARTGLPETFELDVQSGLALSQLAAQGYTSPEVAGAYKRLREIAGGSGGWHEMPGLYGMWAYYNVRGENQATGELAQQFLEAAEASGNPHHVLAAKSVVGYQLLMGGGFRDAVRLFEESRRWLPDDGPRIVPQHVAVVSDVHIATARWILGDARAARVALAQAVAGAESLVGPTADFTRAHVHCYAASLCHVAGFTAGLTWHADRTVAVAMERGFASFIGAGLVLQAVARALSSPAPEHIGALVEALAGWRAAGAETYRTEFLLGLAEALLQAGEPGAAIEAVDEGLAQVARTGERILESPLHLVRGDVLRANAPGDLSGAASAFVAARDVAREQEARTFEVAALARLQSLEAEANGTWTPARRGLPRP
jgi:class 3 adenylate cyclase/tetratricopeptide (TPR) repeat protein